MPLQRTMLQPRSNICATPTHAWSAIQKKNEKAVFSSIFDWKCDSSAARQRRLSLRGHRWSTRPSVSSLSELEDCCSSIATCATPTPLGQRSKKNEKAVFFEFDCSAVRQRRLSLRGHLRSTRPSVSFFSELENCDRTRACKLQLLQHSVLTFNQNEKPKICLAQSKLIYILVLSGANASSKLPLLLKNKD